MWTFIARGLTRLASAAGLLALTVGIPAGQLRYIGWPLPDHLPTAGELRTALTSRDWLTDAALIDEALQALLARHRAAEVDASYAAYDEHPTDEPDEWGDLASWRQAAGASRAGLPAPLAVATS